MKSLLKQLGKDSIIYGLGGLIARSAGFFLLPVYTRIFTPADYGTIQMLVVINSFLGAIMVMGMGGAQSFYFFEQKGNGRKAQANVVTAILEWRIIWGSGIVILATIISPLLNKYFFDGQLSWEYFAVAFGGAFFGQIMNQGAGVFRLLYKPWRYFGITLASTLSSAAIAITLIVAFGSGLIGFFIGMLSGSFLAAIFGWWQLRNYLDFTRWHNDWWPKVLKFGAPLVPVELIHYVLSTADRWFIKYYHGNDTLGLYAVSARFAMFIIAAVTVFRLAWLPIAMDAMHREDGPGLYRTVARFYMGVGSAGIVILTALSPYLVRWLTTPAYYEAYPVVGILAWHSLFYGFYLIGAGGIWKAEKTAWAPFLIGTAALLNIFLDFWLVPLYGCKGAALATSVSFLIWNVLAIIVSEKLWRVGYDYGILLLQVTIGVSACWLTLVLYKQEVSPWSVWFVACITVALLLSLSVTRRYFRSIMRMLRLHLCTWVLQAK